MIQYVAFLRGINVGGNRLVKMEELVGMFEVLGFKNVQTVIASGNVVFDSDETDIPTLIKILQDSLKQSLGYEIMILLRTVPEIAQIVKKYPFKRVSDPNAKQYVTFLAELPPSPLTMALKIPEEGFEIVQIIGREVFWVLYPVENAKTGKSVGYIEREFGNYLTTRNWNTVVKIADMKSI